MTRLSQDERDTIQSRIEIAEGRTSAEFVTVIAGAAESYLFIPTLYAAVLTLVVSGLVLIFQGTLAITAPELYAGQVVLFAALTLLFRVPEFRFGLVPKSIRHNRASRLARQMFLDLGMTETQDRNAVLFFVARGERYVEVIADVGLQAKLADPEVWERIVAGFVEDVREGNVTEGYTRAIDGCADVMAEHFPNRAGEANRFSDRLIEI